MSTKKNDMKTDKQVTSKRGKKNLNRHPEVLRLRSLQEQELNDYLSKNRFYAFDNQEKFDKGMRMLGLDPSETDKIVDVAGGAMRKDRIPELKKLLSKQKADMRNLKRRLVAEMEA